MPRPSVTVVVPVRNGGTTLQHCLDALRDQQDAPAYEVVVVDNGSTDGTAQHAAAHPVVARVISETTVGSYAARNAGLHAAEADVIAFTDADCVPDPRWLVAGMNALTEADLVGGRIHVTAAAMSAVARYDSANYLDQQAYVDEQRFAATANLFVRAAVFETVGSFDATLKSGGDLEFGTRATAGGFRLRYADDAVVRHEPRATYRELWKLNRRLGAGWAALAKQGKRPPFWRDAALRWPTFEMAVGRVNASEPPLRRRQLIGPHLTVMTARWAGRLSGR